MPKKAPNTMTKPRSLIKDEKDIPVCLMGEFLGTPLPAVECSALRELEHIIFQKPLKPLPYMKPFRHEPEIPPTVEFTAKSGHITSLLLEYRGLEVLPACLPCGLTPSFCIRPIVQ